MRKRLPYILMVMGLTLSFALMTEPFQNYCDSVFGNTVISKEKANENQCNGTQCNLR